MCRMAAHQVNYLKAILGFDAVVQRADRLRWDDASPCEGWAARDVVNHMVFMVDMVAGMASGRPAVVEGDVGVPAPGVAGHVLRAGLVEILAGPLIGPDDDPGVVWGEHRDALLDVVSNSTSLDRETLGVWGHRTTMSFLPMAGGDAVVHTWDLARALGQEPVIEPELAQAALDGWMEAESAGLPVRLPMILGEAVRERSGDPLSALLAFTGRDVD
jgi:uncharacterized protein (TIGR03083 family)